jgi:glycosyltransferase involved in cell wall biosynthesis
MSGPLLTVAIPTYNGTAHLAETLHSILTQQCPHFDLLVCDDRSEDETVPMVRAIAGERARIVENPERLGLAGNWNQCVGLNRTPWVSIFHQDDVMLPGHLDWVITKIEQEEQQSSPSGLIAGPVRVIDELSRPVPESVVHPGGVPLFMLPPSEDFLDFPHDSETSRLLWWSNPLRCSAVIINRAAHAEAGGFDPSYRYVVDWEFWYRVCRNRTLTWKRFDPTVLVRWHAASETHRFKTGTDDLEETARLLDHISEQENHRSAISRRRHRLAMRSLSRAFLNRSHEALRNGQTNLARSCLQRAWGLSSGKVLGTLATDLRLSLQIGTLVLSPRLARRWFGRDHERSANVST